MEKLSCSPVSLPAVIGAPVPLSPNIIFNNPVVHNAVKIYLQFRKHFDLQRMSLSSPIASNIFFSPSVLDATFHVWQRQGLKMFTDLHIENSFASFEQLSIKYNLSPSHFFRYFQVRHFVSASIPGFPDKPPYNFIGEVISFNPKKPPKEKSYFCNVALDFQFGFPFHVYHQRGLGVRS